MSDMACYYKRPKGGGIHRVSFNKTAPVGIDGCLSQRLTDLQ